MVETLFPLTQFAHECLCEGRVGHGLERQSVVFELGQDVGTVLQEEAARVVTAVGTNAEGGTSSGKEVRRCNTSQYTSTCIPVHLSLSLSSPQCKHLCSPHLADLCNILLDLGLLHRIHGDVLYLITESIQFHGEQLGESE